MLKIIVLTIASVIVSLAVAQTPSLGGCPTVITQKAVDLQKYLGFWYEIESFPTPFEKGKCIRAQYTMLADGHIQVLNRDIENGKQENATGDAYRPDPNQQGKLLVQFSKGAPYAKYWVIHTDYEQFSMIYSCESVLGVAHVEFAWIVSRNTTLDATIVKKLKMELASYKVDVTKFKVTDQTECPK